MDPSMLSRMMMQMSQMGMQPEDMYRMLQGDLSQSSSQQDRPPAFHPNLSPSELKERITQYKAWLSRDRELGAMPAPRQDRETLLLDQVRTRQIQEADNRVNICTTIVGYERHHSATRLEQLERVPISRMFLRKAHIGNYLLCRVISLPTSLVSVHIIVEDPEGAATSVAIYNLPTTFDCTFTYVDSLFSMGTILAIREPTYKPALVGPFPIVRVDTPTDIVFISPGSQLLQGITWRSGLRISQSPSIPTTTDAWKAQGNLHFKNEKWLPAALSYTHGIRNDPNAIVLYLNRAEAFLRLGWFSSAFSDTRRVLDTPTSVVDADLHHKAMCRAAKAEYGRGNFQQAAVLFESCLASKPKDQDLINWKSRAEKRLKELRSGAFDWIGLLRQSPNNLHPDVADFQGPIEVQPLEDRGGGRGVIATKDITAGELLLVCKPFASFFSEEYTKGTIVYTIDLLGERMKERHYTALYSCIVHRLYGNPDLHDAVFNLYAGPHFSAPPASYSPTSSEQVPSGDIFSSDHNIDITRLEAICTYNCFSPAPKAQSSDVDTSNSCALYLLPSLFNHSCVGNAIWNCIGDVIVIRAAQNIKSGTEVTITYTVGATTYMQRSQPLQQYLPTGCQCQQCQEDRKDGSAALRERENILTELDFKLIDQTSLPHVRSLETKMAATYKSAGRTLRPELAQIQVAVAYKMRDASLVAQAVEISKQALTNMGVVILEAGTGLPIATTGLSSLVHHMDPMGVMICIAADYVALNNRREAIRWLRAARWIASVAVADSKEVFILLNEELLRKIHLLNLAKKAL